MLINTQLKIQRKYEVLNCLGIARSTLAVMIKQGLFTPPINLGARAVGWPQHETNAVLASMVAGKSKDEIKSLVASLIEHRQDFIAVNNNE